MVPLSFSALLEQLHVPRGRLLYVQASADWIQRAGYQPPEVLATLVEWIGQTGTLAMPSYPFAGTHRDYLQNGPVFDVRQTPAAVGLIPEIFRRTKGVVRSPDVDFSVAALGADAELIVGVDPSQPDAFGTASNYQRMLDRHGVHVGLGVSLNTSSFIHLIDSRAESSYPMSPYEDRRFPVTVIDARGQTHRSLRKALRPSFQQLTMPSAVVANMQPGPELFSSVEVNDARFFRWDLDAWSSWCLTHARQRPTGEWPCWLTRLVDQEMQQTR